MEFKFFDQKITRREFLRQAGFCCLGGIVSYSVLEWLLRKNAFAKTDDSLFKHEARYYKKIDSRTVQCELCPRRCVLRDGQRSFCRAREPKNGKLYSLVYGKSCAVHIDPIEKKPLFHFLPGTQIFSIATAGCNFRCKYCQNWQISQFGPDEVYNEELTPEEIVEETIKNKCPSLAYTYSEPSIFFEYMLDITKAARGRGIKNMYHSNGSLNPEPAREIASYLDAADIDLKGFTQKFYSEVSAGYLDTVLETLKILKNNKVWLEITNLVVPGLNDDLDTVKQMCLWIRDNLGTDVPLHFSRFSPQYKLASLNPTPVETLEKIRELAMSVGLNYVYIGNVPGNTGENTYCPGCKKAVIMRSGYIILENNISSAGRCNFCKTPIAGVWS